MKICPKCIGKMSIKKTSERGRDKVHFLVSYEPCPACKGTGIIDSNSRKTEVIYSVK